MNEAPTRSRTRHHWLVVLLRQSASLLLIASVSSASVEDKRPNILLIVLDDFGYHDLGANGNPDTPSPNLDKLANQGIRYTRHYADSTCQASRVALFTGLHPSSLGFRPSHQGISPEVTTLAELTRNFGYETHHIGKWHMGHTSKLSRPAAQGIDHFFGFLDQSLLKNPFDQQGNVQYRYPTYLNPWLQIDEQPPRPRKGHLTNILTQHAIKTIRAGRKGGPWFVNLSFFAPHEPLEPSPTWASKFSNDHVGRYHALINQLDHSVGRVLKVLDKTGQANNTLVIVVSDNGGTNLRTPNNHPFFGRKSTFLEGGVRTPLLVRWPERVDTSRVSSDVVSIFDIYPTVAAAIGAPLPTEMLGQDLLSSEREDRALFWEWSSPGKSSIGYLDKSGRWRITRRASGAILLFDLKSDPSGSVNVAHDNAELAGQLQASFVAERNNASEIQLDYQTLDDRGYARLTGNSFQRAPGYGGFSVGISAWLDTNPTNETEQMILFQRGQWELGHSRSGLRLEIGDLSLRGPALTKGQCNRVVVTSHFMFSPVFPQLNNATVELYLNNVLVDRKQADLPKLPSDDFLQPTVIGADDQGAQKFRGKLGRPVVFNERLVATGDSANLGNDIEMMFGRLCPSL